MRYTTRHDNVLKVIFDFSKRNLASGMQNTADLPGQQYIFLLDIAPTDLRLDIVVRSTSTIHLVELTVPFETYITDAAERKVHRYWDLAKACASSHHRTIITLEVGSRGFKQRALSSSTNCYKPKPLTGRTLNLM